VSQVKGPVWQQQFRITRHKLIDKIIAPGCAQPAERERTQQRKTASHPSPTAGKNENLKKSNPYLFATYKMTLRKNLESLNDVLRVRNANNDFKKNELLQVVRSR
jgi:hypothetical protein